MGGSELGIAVLVTASALIVAIPVALICGKAGFPSWLGVLALVPGLNLLVLWFIALADWPARRTG